MASRPEDQNKLISEIMSLLGKLSEKLGPENREIRQWLLENSTNPKTAELLLQLTVGAARVLEAVGKLEPVNGITVSKEFRIPKGTVSKATRRLIAQRLIEKESKPGNRKEIYFRLTELGRDVFTVHHTFDEQMERGFTRFLQQYSATNLSFVIELLRGAIETDFIALGGDKQQRR